MTKSKSEPKSEVTAIAGVLQITPVEGRLVRKPDGTTIDAAGERVNVDGDETYWLRRINDGDVTASLFSDGDDA